MQQIGRIIEQDSGKSIGVSVAEPNPKPDNPDPNSVGSNAGGTNEPEVIAGYESYSPDTARITGSSGTGKRRGRPPGSRNATRTTEEKAPDSLIDLTNILLGLHASAAALLHIEELELDKVEAQAYGDSIKDVLKFYPHKIDPKMLAWLQLLTVAGGIYGTRIMAYRLRMAREKKERLTVIQGGKSTSTSQANPTASETMAEKQHPATVTPSQVWPESPIDSQVYSGM